MDKYSSGTRNTQQTNTHQINHTTENPTDKRSDNNKSHWKKQPRYPQRIKHQHQQVYKQ
jgi:hypothetical protein